MDHRADIYRSGSFCDMLTGRQRIARRDNAMSEMMSRMQHVPASIRPRHTEALGYIVSKCLQTDESAIPDYG